MARCETAHQGLAREFRVLDVEKMPVKVVILPDGRIRLIQGKQEIEISVTQAYALVWELK